MPFTDSFYDDADRPPVILATLGDSDLSHFVLTTAVRLARGMKHANVHLVHVLPEATASAEDTQGSLLRALGQDRVSSCAEAMSAALDRFVTPHLEYGKPAGAIVALAALLGAEFLVIGASDVGPVRRALFGSTADAVLRTASCSVVLSRPRAAAGA